MKVKRFGGLGVEKGRCAVSSADALARHVERSTNIWEIQILLEQIPSR